MTLPPQHSGYQSLRLHGYDYTQAGAYFVTSCVYQRKCLFGHIQAGEMVLTAAGQMVQQVWDGLPVRYPSIELDAFIVMPNHVHAILVLAGTDTAANSPLLGTVIRAFKSLSAVQVNRALGRSGIPLWQRNYYEHIVRHDKELDHIRTYILSNAVQWELDEENPASSMG
ncbi:MAG: transposase [Chloroflexota bacterium]|nr:transposase [Chloroflexota bacterium]